MFSYAIIAIALLVAAASVILYVKTAESNAASLKQRDATLQAEQERRRATDKADAEAAAARKIAYDQKAHRVLTAADAARLLREAGDDSAN